MTIHIEELTFTCIIGILEHERVSPQRVIITLELDYDFVHEFINYADLANIITKEMQEKKFELLESALEHFFTTLPRQYPNIKRLTMTISKPDILPNCKVSLSNFKIF